MLVPALMRAYWNVNEIITTLLLNFVAVLLVSYFVIGPGAIAAPRSVCQSQLPYLIPKIGTRICIGAFWSGDCGIVLTLVMQGTRWGYEVRIIGGNRRAPSSRACPSCATFSPSCWFPGLLPGWRHDRGGRHVKRLSATSAMTTVYGHHCGCAGQRLLIGGNSAASARRAAERGLCFKRRVSVNAMLAINGVILIFAAVGEVAAATG